MITISTKIMVMVLEEGIESTGAHWKSSVHAFERQCSGLQVKVISSQVRVNDTQVDLIMQRQAEVREEESDIRQGERAL